MQSEQTQPATLPAGRQPLKAPGSPGKRWLLILILLAIFNALVTLFRQGPIEAGIGLVVQLAFFLIVLGLFCTLTMTFHWGIRYIGSATTDLAKAGIVGAVLGGTIWGGSSCAFFAGLDAIISRDGFS